MQVLSELSGHVIVYHSLDAFDIQTSRSKIRGHEIVNCSIPELLQRAKSLSKVVISENTRERKLVEN